MKVKLVEWCCKKRTHCEFMAKKVMELLYLYLVHQQYTFSAPKVRTTGNLCFTWKLFQRSTSQFYDARSGVKPWFQRAAFGRWRLIWASCWPPLSRKGFDGSQCWIPELTRDVFVGPKVSRWKMVKWQLRYGCKPKCEVRSKRHKTHKRSTPAIHTWEPDQSMIQTCVAGRTLVHVIHVYLHLGSLYWA